MSRNLTTMAIGLMRRWFKDGWQNGKTYPVNSMWTGGRGAGVAGLSFCQRRGWIVSHSDEKFNSCGYRHDITPAGREALARSPQEAGAPQ